MEVKIGTLISPPTSIKGERERERESKTKKEKKTNEVNGRLTVKSNRMDEYGTKKSMI